MDVAEVACNDDGRRTFVVVLDRGDDVISNLRSMAARHGIDAASLSAIGALSGVTLGFYRRETRTYDEIPVDEQVEVASLLGNLSRDEQGDVVLHAHGVVARSDGSTVGGHVLAARVEPTLEVVVEESPAHLVRRYRPDLGLSLIDLPNPSVLGHGPDLGL
jgi:uncharacterized protein